MPEFLASSPGLLKHNGSIGLLDLVVQALRARISLMLGLSFASSYDSNIHASWPGWHIVVSRSSCHDP